MIFQNGFLGIKHGETVEFSNEDPYEAYQDNLASLGSEWEYATKKITYSYNLNGHRCKELVSIDLDNYILFTGCSHTAGTGLALEDTYAHRVAQGMGCDYYNLALPGTGIDTMIYNLSAWMNLVEKRPKYLFIQWPDIHRFVNFVGNNNKDTDIQLVYVGRNDPTYTKFLLDGSDIGYFNSKKILAENLINTMIIPSYHIYAGTDYFGTDTSNGFIFRKVDDARDRSHYGSKSNENLAHSIITGLR